MKKIAPKNPEGSKRFVDEMREIYHSQRNERLDMNAEEMLTAIRIAVKKAVENEKTFVVFDTDSGGLDDPDKEPIFRRVLVLLNETGLTHDLDEDRIKEIGTRKEISDITLSGWETPMPEVPVSTEAPTAKTLKDKGYFEKLAEGSRRPKKKSSK